MSRNCLHILACWIGTVAFLANVAAASTGLVYCQAPDGNLVIELECEHDHCPPTSADHDHCSADSCICDNCPCEDQPLEAKVATATKRLSAEIHFASNSGFAIRTDLSHHWRHIAAAPWLRHAVRVPAADGALGALRVIRLLI